MLYPHHWWQRLTPTVHHRIERVVIALLAFTAGLAVIPAGTSALRAVDRAAAVPVIAVPATTAEDLQRALELYRQGEREAYRRTGPAAATSAAELQHGMELYREGERGLWSSPERVVAPATTGQELQRAMERYRQGERALHMEMERIVPPSD